MTGIEKIIARIPEESVLICGEQGEYWTDIVRFSTASPVILCPAYKTDELHAQIEAVDKTDFSAIFIAWGVSDLIRDREICESLFDRLRDGGMIFGVELLNDAHTDASRQNHRNFLNKMYQTETLPKNRIVSLLKTLNMTQLRTLDCLDFANEHTSEDFFSLKDYTLNKLKKISDKMDIIENIEIDGIKFAPFTVLQGFKRNSGNNLIETKNASYIKAASLTKIDNLKNEIFQYGADKVDLAGLLSAALDLDVGMSDKILMNYGGKSLLKEQSIEKIASELGIDDEKAVKLISILELGRRIFAASDEKVIITSPEKAVKILDDMRELKREQLRGLYLDARGKLLFDDVLAVGHLNKTSAPPREILAPALEHGAAAIIIANNHPSGIAEPSGSD